MNGCTKRSFCVSESRYSDDGRQMSFTNFGMAACAACAEGMATEKIATPQHITAMRTIDAGMKVSSNIGFFFL